MRFQTPVQSRHSSKTSRRLELNRGVTPCSSEAGNHLRYFLEAHLVPRWAQHVELLSFHLPKHTQRELRDTHETLVCLCVFWLYLTNTHFPFLVLVNSTAASWNRRLCTTMTPRLFKYYSHSEAGWIVLMMSLHKQAVRQLPLVYLHFACGNRKATGSSDGDQ